MTSSRLGFDFSAVRIHDDDAAAHAADAVSARAFTLGRHIVFGAGEYAPRSPQGRRLLAHELVHVIQQAGVRTTATGVQLSAAQSVAGIQRQGDPDMGVVRIVDSLRVLTPRPDPHVAWPPPAQGGLPGVSPLPPSSPRPRIPSTDPGDRCRDLAEEMLMQWQMAQAIIGFELGTRGRLRDEAQRCFRAHGRGPDALLGCRHLGRRAEDCMTNTVGPPEMWRTRICPHVIDDARQCEEAAERLGRGNGSLQDEITVGRGCVALSVDADRFDESYYRYSVSPRIARAVSDLEDRLVLRYCEAKSLMALLPEDQRFGCDLYCYLRPQDCTDSVAIASPILPGLRPFTIRTPMSRREPSCPPSQ